MWVRSWVPSPRWLLRSWTASPTASKYQSHAYLFLIYAQADMWSLGAIFFEMLFGYAPFKDPAFRKLSLMRLKDPSKLVEANCSQESRELLVRMLVEDQQQRISWSELYEVPLLKQRKTDVLQTYQIDFGQDDMLVSQKLHIAAEQKDQKQNIVEEVEYQLNKKEIKIKTAKPKTEVDNDDNGPANKPTPVYDIEINKIDEDSCQDDLASDLKMLPQGKDEEEDNLRCTQELTEKFQTIRSYVARLTFEKQKSSLLSTGIIDRMNRLPLKQNRDFFDLQHKVISRCFYLLSPTNDVLIRNRNTFQWKYYDDFIKTAASDSLVREFKFHYSYIKSTKEAIEASLYDKEKQLKSYVRNGMDFVFDHSNYKTKSVISSGIEKIDYEQQEHVAVTVRHFIVPLQDKLKKMIKESKEHTREGKIAGQLMELLEQYQHIIKADIEEKDYIMGLVAKYCGIDSK